MRITCERCTIRVAITDLQPRILAEISETFDILRGPTVVLNWMEKQPEALLSQIGKTTGDVLGIGIGLPAAVDYANGWVVGPSVMVGWDNFEIRQYLEEKFGVPVYAENDVNLLALNDHRRRRTNVSEMVFVKVGTGIGSGISIGTSTLANRRFGSPAIFRFAPTTDIRVRRCTIRFRAIPAARLVTSCPKHSASKLGREAFTPSQRQRIPFLARSAAQETSTEGGKR